MSSRDPFQAKKFENDFILSGNRPRQRKPSDKPTHIAQMEEPWSRLHNADTSSSLRRSVYCLDRQAPRDSLDFQLASIYDHSKNFLWEKNQTFYQKKTIHHDQRKHINMDMQDKQKQEDIRVWVSPMRCSIHSIK